MKTVSECFKAGVVFLVVCLQCNDALMWCCSARSDGVNSHAPLRSRVVGACVPQGESNRETLSLEMQGPCPNTAGPCYAGWVMPSVLGLSGAGFLEQFTWDQEGHSHFKDQIHQRYFLTLQKCAWEIGLLIFEARILLFGGSSRVRRMLTRQSDLSSEELHNSWIFFFSKCNIILQYRWAEEGCVLISVRQNSVSLGHLSPSSIFVLCSLKDEALLWGIEILHPHCYSRSLWSLSLSSFEVFCRLYRNNKKFVLLLGVWATIILLNCWVLSSLCTRQSQETVYPSALFMFAL